MQYARSNVMPSAASASAAPLLALSVTLLMAAVRYYGNKAKHLPAGEP